MPLTVMGVDALGRPFQERTSTLIINCHGCRYPSKHYVLKNMWVALEVPHPETGQEPRKVRARVTWILRPRTVRELFQIGVELEVPGNAWGIAFPPSDWFPFPETPVPQIPSPGAEDEAEVAAEEWVLPGAAMPQDNVRVLPGPGAADLSTALTRQVARLVTEAKQQVQNAAREATAQVEAEAQPLLAAIQDHMREAAERAAQAAGASFADEMLRQTSAKIDEAREVGFEALREQLSSELERHFQEAETRLTEHLAQMSTAHQADFQQQVDARSRQALEKLNRLSSEIATGAASKESGLAHLRQEIEDTTEAASRRWHEALEGRVGEASVRLDKLEQAARQLNKEISAATAAAEAGWRGRLDADLTAAGTRWNERIETSLESAAQQAAKRLARHSQNVASKLEQEFAARVTALRQSLEKAAAEGESTLGTLRTALAEIQQTIGRLKEDSSQFEKDFEEAGRAATARWLAELDAKAADTTHTTFEALYKCSEWYEKKVQTHMQATIDKGLEQASNNLREKAGEISGLFASELDHRSRSYVEHTQGQIDEAIKEAVDGVRGQLAQAAEGTAAAFGGQIHGLARRQVEEFTESLGSAFDQSAAHLEAHMTQARAKMDAEARQFFLQFQEGMTQRIQDGTAEARQELEAQIAPLKEALRAEREAQQQHLQEALAHLGNESIEIYRKRLENVSNSWLLATVTKLNQQAQNLIETLASFADQQLRETCSRVFSSAGEALRQRLTDVFANLPLAAPRPRKEAAAGQGSPFASRREL